MGEEIRVTVIATGFDHGGLRAAPGGAHPRAARPQPANRGASRDSLVIRDDDLDIPPFLR